MAFSKDFYIGHAFGYVVVRIKQGLLQMMPLPATMNLTRAQATFLRDELTRELESGVAFK